MADEKQHVKVEETIILKKFDGDDQTQKPVEVITIKRIDGNEVSRTITTKGDSDAPTN